MLAREPQGGLAPRQNYWKGTMAPQAARTIISAKIVPGKKPKEKSNYRSQRPKGPSGKIPVELVNPEGVVFERGRSECNPPPIGAL